jgi:hypothetical protein
LDDTRGMRHSKRTRPLSASNSFKSSPVAQF